MTPEEAPDGRRAMEFTQTSGPPMETLAHGCICSYTWADGKPCRNGPMESCQALHPEDVTVTINGGEPVPGEWGQVQYVPGLEDRVAALEALLLAEPSFQAPESWTPEQVEKFTAEWGCRKYEPVRLPPPAPLLTPETARALLSECVTVVCPGETLVIRAPESWTPEQAGRYQEYADALADSGRISFPVLVVLGDELGVARPEPDNAPDNPATEG